MKKKNIQKSVPRNVILQRIFLFLCIFSLLFTGVIYVKRYVDYRKNIKQQEELAQEKVTQKEKELTAEFRLPTVGVATLFENIDFSNFKQVTEPEILLEYQSLYEQNQDLIGWLKIDDTVIDYPVMQTPGDEDYYLDYDFYGQENINGSLILDTDSNAGVGTLMNDYVSSNVPSTNLIIHGHTMKSGQMFGNLKLYKYEDYGMAHNIIYFDSLYEKREYELIAVFYSQVYYENQDVFKYYKFFQADTREELDDWNENIKHMSLYNTGVTATFGDEFITLSSCSYQVEDGRFVVVGKRVK